MIRMLLRIVQPIVAHALETFPVIVLAGARQTGKSTLAKDLESPANRRYLTLDTAVNRALAITDPQAFLQTQTHNHSRSMRFSVRRTYYSLSSKRSTKTGPMAVFCLRVRPFCCSCGVCRSRWRIEHDT